MLRYVLSERMEFRYLPVHGQSGNFRMDNPELSLSTEDSRAMHSLANSDHSPCSSKTKLLHIEFSDLHISKVDSVKSWRNQLQGQLLEAEYVADEDSVLGKSKKRKLSTAPANHAACRKTSA